jgi:hypothetical protein
LSYVIVTIVRRKRKLVYNAGNMESEKYFNPDGDSKYIYWADASEEIGDLYWPAIVPEVDAELICAKTLFLLDDEAKVQNVQELGSQLQMSGIMLEDFFDGFPMNVMRQKAALLFQDFHMVPCVLYQMMSLGEMNQVGKYMYWGVLYLNEDSLEEFWRNVTEFAGVLCQQGSVEVAKRYYSSLVKIASVGGIEFSEDEDLLTKIPDLWDFDIVQELDPAIYDEEEFIDLRAS